MKLDIQLELDEHEVDRAEVEISLKKIPCLQSPNVFVCAAIPAMNGLIHYRAVNGSYTALGSKIFMCELIDLVKKQNIANPLFIFDNCRIHAVAKIDVLEAF